MKKIKLHYIFLAVLLLNVCATQAQVTIGSDKQPAKGAILDLKEFEASDAQSINGTSANRGLGMPRVDLTSINNLFPMFEGYTAPNTYFIGSETFEKDKEDAKHIGLTVYNLNEDSNLGFEKGIYFWDGTQWLVIGRQALTGLKFFYMPSINIDFTDTGVGSVNVYDMYVKQFTKTGNLNFISSDNTIEKISASGDGKLYKVDELSYVVTYFDPKVIEINSIGADGQMDYEIMKTTTTADSYINLIFVIK